MADFKEYSDGSFSSGGYNFDKGGNIISSPKKKSGGGGSSSNRIEAGEGAYINIDDINNPNAPVYTREGESFQRVTEPVVVRRRGGGGKKNFQEVTQQVNILAEQSRAKETVSNIESGRKFKDLTGMGTSNAVEELAYKGAVAKTQSVWLPTAQEVARVGAKGKASRENVMRAQREVLTNQITEIATRDAKSFAESEGNRAKREYEQAFTLEETKLDAKYQEIQNKINAGGDYNKLSKEWEQYQKQANTRLKNKAEQLDKRTQTKINNYLTNWKQTRGKSFERDAGLVLRSTDRLSRLSKKEMSKRFGGAFVKGAVIGGGVTGLLQATGTKVSAGAGAVITGVGAGVSLGFGYASAGYDVATGKLDRSEFATEGGTRAVEGGVSFLGGFSGAVTGSVAVATASRLIQTGVARGITINDKRLATRAIEKNGFKMSSKVKGQVSEGTIKNLKIDAQGKTELLNQVKAGNTIRKTVWRPDTTGLNKAEIGALKKFGLKVESYAVVDTQGNIIKTIEVSRVIGRAPITRVAQGADTIVSSGQGTIKGGKVNLIRQTAYTKGMSFRDRLTLNRQFQNRVQETGIEKVTGKGSVRYDRGFRLEQSTGRSESFIRFKPDRTELFPKITDSKTTFLSKQNIKIKGLAVGGDRAIVLNAKGYSDLLGSGTSLTRAPSFLWGKTAPSRAFRSISSPTTGGTGGTTTSSGQSLFTPSTIQTQTTSPTILSGVTSQSATSIISATPSNTQISILPPATIQSSRSSQRINTASPNLDIGIRSISTRSTRQRESFFSTTTRATPSQNSLFTPSQRAEQIPATKPNQLTSPVTEVIQTPSSTVPNGAIPSLGFTNITPVTGKGFGLPFLGRVKVGGGGFGIREKGGLSRKTAYNPSLGSVLINYRKPAKKTAPQSLSKKTFSGLSLRPQLDFSTKKKKKRKKKKKK